MPAAAVEERVPASSPAAADGDLLSQIAVGSEAAFQLLWNRYGAAIYTACHRQLRDAHAAEDATQEAFASIWRGARTFDPSRGSAAAWLYTIARHSVIQLLRRQHGESVETLLEGQADRRAYDPVTRLAVHAALTRLSPAERQVIELAYFEDMTQSAIAARLRLPLGTVKTRTRSALQRLARYLEDADV